MHAPGATLASTPRRLRKRALLEYQPIRAAIRVTDPECRNGRRCGNGRRRRSGRSRGGGRRDGRAALGAATRPLPVCYHEVG